jgi:hypothetical protein
MSTRPDAGSPDELVWLRGFEEARNHFLAENKRLREALVLLRDALVFRGFDFEKELRSHEEPVSQSIARTALEGK